MPRAPTIDPGPGLGGVDPVAPPTCTAQWVGGVSGRVEDPSGQGIAGARTQICVVPSGATDWLCLVPPTTDAGGDFEALIEEPTARCIDRMTMRVLLPGASSATTYCQIALSPMNAVQTLADPILLFPTSAPPCLPELGDSAEPRTIELADGLELVDLRPDRITGYAELEAARHDLTGECILAGAPAGGFVGAYGFRPESDVMGGVAVRIPNTTGLAAGTSVELYVMGGLDTRLTDGTRVAEGDWARIGTGTVAADTESIDSDAGTLLTVLTWLAYRVAP